MVSCMYIHIGPMLYPYIHEYLTHNGTCIQHVMYAASIHPPESPESNSMHPLAAITLHQGRPWTVPRRLNLHPPTPTPTTVAAASKHPPPGSSSHSTTTTIQPASQPASQPYALLTTTHSFDPHTSIYPPLPHSQLPIAPFFYAFFFFAFPHPLLLP
ncbi:hypothetical protein BDR22DRAFT_189797 [Usnea florida]